MGDGRYFRSGVMALGVTAIIIAVIGLTGTRATAQSDQKQVRWRTATQVSDQLKQSIGTAGYSWQGVSLRRALRSLSESEGVRIAIVLDRRVDPGKKLNLTFDEQPLENVLLQIAAVNDIGMCQIGPVIYFGPKWTTHRL